MKKAYYMTVSVCWPFWGRIPLTVKDSDNSIIVTGESSGFPWRSYTIEGEQEHLSTYCRVLSVMRKKGWYMGEASGIGPLGPRFNIEKQWVTKAGLKACVIMGYLGHRCGYVQVPKDHPLFGVEYSVSHPALKPPPEGEELGKRGIVPLFTHAMSGDKGNSADIVFDVHGGVTYSGDLFPVKPSEGTWCFGFDAGHCDDAPAEDSDMHRMCPSLYSSGQVHRSTEYMADECERLADQLLIGDKVRRVTPIEHAVWYLTSRFVLLDKWFVMQKVFLGTRLIGSGIYGGKWLGRKIRGF